MHFDEPLRSLSGVLWHKLLQRQAQFVEKKDMAGLVLCYSWYIWYKYLSVYVPMHDLSTDIDSSGWRQARTEARAAVSELETKNPSALQQV